MAEAFPSVSFLIPKLKSGDEQAWTEMHSRFRIGLTSKARQLVLTCGDRKKNVNADDLVQETLVKVWRKRESFRGETTSQLAKWMLTILKNTFLDICRRKNIEQSKETWRSVPALSPTPSAIAVSAEQEAELLAALDELSLQQQEVISMRIFERLSFPEIAKLMEINVNTLGGIYRRGLIRVTKILRQNELG